MTADTPPYRVAIMGFGPVETDLLRRHFATAAGFGLVMQPQQAQLIVADGSNTAQLAQLEAMRPHALVLLVGANATYPNLPFESRPIHLGKLLHAATYLLGQAQSALTQPAGLRNETGYAPTEHLRPEQAQQPDHPSDAPTQWLSNPAPLGSDWQATARAPAPPSRAYAATEPVKLTRYGGFAATQRVSVYAEQPTPAALQSVLQTAAKKRALKPTAGTASTPRPSVAPNKAVPVHTGSPGTPPTSHQTKPRSAQPVRPTLAAPSSAQQPRKRWWWPW